MRTACTPEHQVPPIILSITRNILSRASTTSTMATSIPSAVAGKILRNFMVISGTACGGICAVYQVFNIATRKEMAENGRGHLMIYNTVVHPEQDKLDTIFDRTKIMNQVKAKKPWNMTYAEKERARHESS